MSCLDTSQTTSPIQSQSGQPVKKILGNNWEKNGEKEKYFDSTPYIVQV